MEKNLIKVAICYDCDDTLTVDNTQQYGFMRTLGITPKDFWELADRIAKEHNADKILSYMLAMLKEAEEKGISLTKENLTSFGEDIALFDGVEDWFTRINKFARENGIELHHYIISSGIKEIIEGMPISKEFTKIYACSFMFDENGKAFWPAQVINYTTKTQYLFRISKGCLDESDESVNNKTTKEQWNIPFNQMLYIGDGLTDVPCMATLKKYNGQTLAVLRPDHEKSVKCALKLLEDGRVDNIAPADYSEGSRVDELVKEWLLKIKADNDLMSN